MMKVCCRSLQSHNFILSCVSPPSLLLTTSSPFYNQFWVRGDKIQLEIPEVFYTYNNIHSGATHAFYILHQERLYPLYTTLKPLMGIFFETPCMQALLEYHILCNFFQHETYKIQTFIINTFCEVTPFSASSHLSFGSLYDCIDQILLDTSPVTTHK